MATFIYPKQPVIISGGATEATQLLVLAELVDVNMELDSQSTLMGTTNTELAAVNSELNTQSALLTTIDANTGSIDTKLTVTNAELVLVNSELDSQTALLTTIDADTGAIAVSVASVDTKLTTTNNELADVNTELNSQTALLTTIDADTSAIAVSVASVDTKLTTTNTELADVNTELNTQTTELTAIKVAVEALEAQATLTVVDFIDSTPLLDASSSNIPGSASLPLQLVASLAADVKKVQSVEDLGEFLALYTGAASSEVLLCLLPLGGGEVSVEVPAGTRISIRNMKNAAVTSGFIGINFLG